MCTDAVCNRPGRVKLTRHWVNGRCVNWSLATLGCFDVGGYALPLLALHRHKGLSALSPSIGTPNMPFVSRMQAYRPVATGGYHCLIPLPDTTA